MFEVLFRWISYTVLVIHSPWFSAKAENIKEVEAVRLRD